MIILSLLFKAPILSKSASPWIFLTFGTSRRQQPRVCRKSNVMSSKLADLERELLERLHQNDLDRQHLLLLLQHVRHASYKEEPVIRNALEEQLLTTPGERVEIQWNGHSVFEEPCGYRNGEGMARSPGQSSSNLRLPDVDENENFVEFRGPGTQGKCRRAWGFTNEDSLSDYARFRGKFKHAPRDGWYQIVDGSGKIRVIT